jgi:uncharacterized protein YkwD
VDPAVQAALERINALRAEAGAGPLTLDAALGQAAQGHARDMAAENYFSHTSPDGRTAAERVTASGYRWSAVAENIASGQADWSATIDGWMGSSEHRANMLNPTYEEVGLGRSEQLYVANFAAPRT